MTTSPWPFSWPSPDSWGAELDEAAAIIAASPRRAAATWQQFPVHKVRVGKVVGRVSLHDIGAPAWEANVLVDGSIRDLGWFHTAAEGKAAVEQVIGELAAET